MTSPTPTLETVIAAVKTAIDGVNESFGTVLDSGPDYDSTIEFLEEYKIYAAGANKGKLDLWIVTCPLVIESEGRAPGENYSVYRINCEYWNIRVADATWEKTARTAVETVRDALSGNASIFRIGNQIQVYTPEIASIEMQGFEPIEDQLIFRALIALDVEARRWS